MEAVQKEMTEALSKANADHELRMKQLQDQVDALERQLTEVVEKNREEEHRLRKEKGRAESSLNAKIFQYDEDMHSRQKALNELNEQYTVESAEYAVLKEYFDKIDSDLNRSSEEESLINAVMRRKTLGNRILYAAATRIQKIFRGRRLRLSLTKLNSKNKKGKKGKKGGK